MIKEKTMTLTDWIREEADSYEDREALVVAAEAEFPSRSRSDVIRRMNDQVSKGTIKSKPPTDATPRGGGGQITGPRKKKSASKRSPKEQGKVPKKFNCAVSVDDVAEEYDDEGRIEEGLDNLGGQIIKENDFRMELGISQERWKVAKEMGQFRKNRIDLTGGKRFRGVFWGQEAVIADVRSKTEMK